jgi:hypothetical protein
MYVCFFILLKEYNGIKVDIMIIVILSVLFYNCKPLLYWQNTMFLIWHECGQEKQWHGYNNKITQLLDLFTAYQIFCSNRCWKFHEWYINKEALFPQDVVSSSHDTTWVDCSQVIYTEFQITLLEEKILGKCTYSDELS